MSEREGTSGSNLDKGKSRAEEEHGNLLQRIKNSTTGLVNDISNSSHSLSNATVSKLNQLTNSKQTPNGSGTRSSSEYLYELEQSGNLSKPPLRESGFRVENTRLYELGIEDRENGFQTWRSEENDGTEILGFLEQQLPSELVPTQLPVRELSQKWVAEFENLGIKEENTWHTPKDDGADVLNFLHSPEFPNNLIPDSIENRSDVHEKWYQEFERLNFGVDTGQGHSISEDDLPLEQTLNEWEKEFNLDTGGSQAHYDIDAFREGPIKEYEALSSSVESTPLPYTPTQDVGYHDPRMDGQEVLEFLNHALYSEEVSEDFSDPANLTSKRQSQYQSLSKPVDRKYTSDILEYLVCIPYTDEVYGSYDFSWIDTRADTKTKPIDASVPNQYESALQRLRLLKKHLTPST